MRFFYFGDMWNCFSQNSLLETHMKVITNYSGLMSSPCQKEEKQFKYQYEKKKKNNLVAIN